MKKTVALFLLISVAAISAWSIDAPMMLARPDLTWKLHIDSVNAGLITEQPDDESDTTATTEDPWSIFRRDVLSGDILPVSLGSDQDLDDDLSPYRVIILPGTTVLDSVARNNVQKVLASGGGVLATGPVGIRNPDGSWAGYDFLNQLIGSEPTLLNDTGITSANMAFQLRSGYPGTVGITPRILSPIVCSNGAPNLDQCKE